MKPDHPKRETDPQDPATAAERAQRMRVSPGLAEQLDPPDLSDPFLREVRQGPVFGGTPPPPGREGRLPGVVYADEVLADLRRKALEDPPRLHPSGKPPCLPR